jgi:phosphatidate cytidylyltransferase
LTDRDRLVRALLDLHPVYVFLMLPALSAVAGDTRDFLACNAKLQWGLMLTVFAIGRAPALLLLDFSGYRLRNALLPLYLMLVVQISDVFQYVFGKLFGRTRLSPAISPSKTVEGLLGGGLTAVLIGAGLSGITPFSLLQAAAMSVVIVVGGLFGGFVLSPIKRDLGVKDWGRMIEGHGGILDRIRLGVVRLDAVLPPDTLLFRDITGGRRGEGERS